MRARLAALVLALGAGASAAAAEPYVVCDNGLRCVRAPCPSTNALDLASGADPASPGLTRSPYRSQPGSLPAEPFRLSALDAQGKAEFKKAA